MQGFCDDMKLIIKKSDNDGRLALVDRYLDTDWRMEVVDEYDDIAFPRALADADAIVSMNWHWSFPALKLKLLHLPGAGVDGIEFDKVPATVSVCNVYGHDIGIAEYVMAGILEFTIGLMAMDRALRRSIVLPSFESPLYTGLREQWAKHHRCRSVEVSTR